MMNNELIIAVFKTQSTQDQNRLCEIILDNNGMITQQQNGTLVAYWGSFGEPTKVKDALQVIASLEAECLKVSGAFEWYEPISQVTDSGRIKKSISAMESLATSASECIEKFVTSHTTFSKLGLDNSVSKPLRITSLSQGSTPVAIYSIAINPPQITRGYFSA